MYYSCIPPACPITDTVTNFEKYYIVDYKLDGTALFNNKLASYLIGTSACFRFETKLFSLNFYWSYRYSEPSL